MGIGHKITALISLLLSLAFLALALAGLYGAVWARGEVSGYVRGMAAVADGALGRAQSELAQGGADIESISEATGRLAAGIEGASARIEEGAVGRAAARVVDFERIFVPIATPLNDLSARLGALGDRMARASEDMGRTRAGLPAAQGRINSGVTVVAGLLALLFFLQGVSRMTEFLRALARLIGLHLREDKPAPAATLPQAIAQASPVVVVAPRIVVNLPPAAAPAPRLAPPPERVAVTELPMPELPAVKARPALATQPLPMGRPARPLREPPETPWEEPPPRLAGDDPRKTRRLPETDELE